MMNEVLPSTSTSGNVSAFGLEPCTCDSASSHAYEARTYRCVYARNLHFERRRSCRIVKRLSNVMFQQSSGYCFVFVCSADTRRSAVKL